MKPPQWLHFAGDIAEAYTIRFPDFCISVRETSWSIYCETSGAVITTGQCNGFSDGKRNALIALSERLTLNLKDVKDVMEGK